MDKRGTHSMKKLIGIFIFTILLSVGCSEETEVKDGENHVGDIRIAAVGDSITAEYTTNAGYPEILDDMLGENYTVLNFGKSNYAAQASSDFPYETSDLFQDSLAFKPHIVIFMLGTNDTKARNWEGPERFKKEYIDLLKNYMRLQNSPRIILVSPPTVFTEPLFKGSIDSNYIPLIRNATAEVAEQYHLEFVDLTTKTKNSPEWFFDGIHPTAEGAKNIAQILYEQIQKKEQ